MTVFAPFPFGSLSSDVWYLLLACTVATASSSSRVEKSTPRVPDAFFSAPIQSHSLFSSALPHDAAGSCQPPSRFKDRLYLGVLFVLKTLFLDLNVKCVALLRQLIHFDRQSIYVLFDLLHILSSSFNRLLSRLLHSSEFFFRFFNRGSQSATVRLFFTRLRTNTHITERSDAIHPDNFRF